MFTIFVEVLLGVFIANYKAVEHPYLTCFIKGILLGVVSFTFSVVVNFYNENYMEAFDLFKYFIITQLLGLMASFIFFILELILPDKKEDK